MTRRAVLLAAAFCLAAIPPAGTHGAPSAPRLLIALASFRDRPLHPRVYFYEHDGVAAGRPVGGIEPANLLVDTHPTLALGGRLCACASELENNPSGTRLWNRDAGMDVRDLPDLNTPAPEIGAAISADGGWLAFSAWNRPNSPAGWNIFLYDLRAKRIAPLPLNTDDEEQAPTLSGNGRLVGFVSNRPGGAGLLDIYLFDRAAGALLPLPGLNSSRRDLDPALSADGRYLAFTSDRPGGSGSRDVYLYDLTARKLVPLPGLNGVGIDQTPALSPDGRFLAFVAERVSGAGERDVYLYDRSLGRLLPTPELNTRSEDFDPAVTYLE